MKKSASEWLYSNSWAIMVALVLGIFWGGYNWAQIGSMSMRQNDLILEIAKLKSEVADIKLAVSTNSYQNEVDAEINKLVVDLDKRIDVLINSNKTTQQDISKIRDIVSDK